MSQSLYSGARSEQVAADLTPLLDFQAEGLSPKNLNMLLSERLLPHLMRYDLPQFQSMFNAVPADEAKLGARIALDFNQGVTNWQVSPGGAMLEELCAQALCRLFGLGPGSDATFMYSGTYANQQALYLALHRFAERCGFDLAREGLSAFEDARRLAILISEDAHFSRKHAARMLGLGEQSLVLIPVDGNRRMDSAALLETVDGIKTKRDFVCVVATAGTTSTGAVDSIEALADLCAETGAWLHVDGAYGYAYKLVPEWAHLFAGDERADSITWDPHKQLGAPIPNSVLFVKQKSDFTRMALHSDYFNKRDDVEPNPGLKSPPSTRMMSALPLVTLLRGMGLVRVIGELRAPLLAIRQLAEYLQGQPDIELCHQPDTGILCFRMRPAHVPNSSLSDLQSWLYDCVMATGGRTFSVTQLAGETVLRLVSVSPHTTFADFRETIDSLRGLVSSGDFDDTK